MENKIKKRTIASAAIIVVVGLVLIGGYVVGRTGQIPPTDVKVALKWLHQAQFAGMYVAHDSGLYDNKNISVDLIEFEQGKSVVDQVLDDEMQFGILGANDLLTAIDRGANIKAIAAIYQASPYVIASLKGSEILTPRDLKGKRLGVKGGFNAEGYQIFQLVTTSAGLDEDEVEFIGLDFSTTEKDDLLNNTVDAIGLYRTRLYQFEQDGINFNAIYPEQYGTPVYNDIIFARSDYIESNPKVVQAFLDATIMGWEQVIRDPEAAIDSVMKYVNDDQFRDRRYQNYILSSSIPLIKPSNKAQIGEMSWSRWELLKDALVSRGALSEKFELESAFTTDFID